MNISKNGLKLIKEFEGCFLKAYKDPVGVWTIGWGTTSADKEITGTYIKQGMFISQSLADKWLEESINKKYSPKVNKYNSIYNFNQNQFDSLVSFAYNVGSIDQLSSYGTRSIEEISNHILAYNKAGGKVLPGLTRRRKAEKELFDKGADEEMRRYINGSTKEDVFADTSLTIKIGSLNPREECDCYGIFSNLAVVRYKVDGKMSYKVGFVKWVGGVK